MRLWSGTMYRPLSWLAEQGFQGNRAWVELHEVGVSGWATVTGVTAAPREQVGEGCLVLMTIEHVASEVLRLHLDRGDETLELTPTHKLYVEGLGWTPAAELKPDMVMLPRFRGHPE